MSTVLIIEDDKNISGIFKKVVESLEHEVFVADSVEEAEETLKTVTPNIYIVDRMLPGESGDSFIGRHDFGPAVAFMVTGSEFDNDYVADKMNSGLLYVLKKPVSLNVLRECVKAADRLNGLRESQLRIADTCDELRELLNRAEVAMREAVGSNTPI